MGSPSTRRLLAIIGVAVAIALLLTPPIPQDPRYHAFADGRRLFGVPNFWNVVSNLPFLAVAWWGLAAFRSRESFTERWERAAFGILLAGTAAVGIGSAYYHWAPSDATLFWDRLPMTVVFASLVATTIGERVNLRAGRLLLCPLILLGIIAVCSWRLTGDLRLYGLVQYGSMLAIPILLLRFPPRYSGGRAWGMVGLYLVAKALELLDRPLASILATGGHPWKHVAAAAAIFLYIGAVRARRPLASGPADDFDRLTTCCVPPYA